MVEYYGFCINLPITILIGFFILLYSAWNCPADYISASSKQNHLIFLLSSILKTFSKNSILAHLYLMHNENKWFYVTFIRL